MAGNNFSEKIELLSVDLLDQNRPLVSELKKIARSLRLEFGWHYLLDLTWIIKLLGQIDGKRMIDAGAGTGIIQWYLAKEGAEVVSVDRMRRDDLPLRFRGRFHVKGLREQDLLPSWQVFKNNFTRKIDGPFYRQWAAKIAIQTREVIGLLRTPISNGAVLVYNHDMVKLPDIADNSVDAVVAISALEHNTPEGLEQVVAELMRVLRPGGALVATLTAARDQDFWHQASSGWCYTDASLRRIFTLPSDTPSNYDLYDQLFAALRDCAELRDNLAEFYFQSGDNGMPWGKWNPQYQPVGVCKVKTVHPNNN